MKRFLDNLSPTWHAVLLSASSGVCLGSALFWALRGEAFATGAMAFVAGDFAARARDAWGRV